MLHVNMVFHVPSYHFIYRAFNIQTLYGVALFYDADSGTNVCDQAHHYVYHSQLAVSLTTF